MTIPVGPQGNEPKATSPIGGSKDVLAPGKPLAPGDPWVKNLASLFPNAPLGELMKYAGAFRDNMFQAMNSQISRDLKKAREAARKFKDVIEGRD